MNITFEERQLMSLYNTGTRVGLIAALEEMRGYLAADETELRELTDNAAAKLRRMSDAEYDALDLFPDFEKEDMDAIFGAYSYSVDKRQYENEGSFKNVS